MTKKESRRGSVKYSVGREQFEPVSGLEKALELGKKIGRTYNKIAQWLALPRAPDVLLGSEE